MTKHGGFWLLLLSLLMLSGCTSSEDLAMARLKEQARQTEREVARLGEHIDRGHIANTRRLQEYGQIVLAMVKEQSPEMQGLVETLMLDSTSKGPLYTGIKARLEDANSDLTQVKGFAAMEDLQQEFASIAQASEMDNYGWMLTDPINVLADMSGGKLARVEAMSKEASLRANNAQDFGPGSQLVGNPTYGQWQQNSSGQSFWHWYGQYAFFSSLFHRPIYYDNWSRYRDYSYYNEAGRNYYTSRNQQKAQQQVEQRTRKKFQQSGKSFVSPYAKQKTGSARATAQVNRTQKSFSSPYSSRSAKPATSSSRSSFGSNSSRNSSFRTSRSFGGGGK